MLQQPYDLYQPGYIDAYVLGMVSQPSQAMDSSITHQVTNHLFQEPSKRFGRDLASINIARAREHGVPGYMAFRKICGLDDMRSWDDMWNHLPNETVRHYLHLYSHPDDIDLWSAGVSEFPAPGSMLGPVFSCIIGMTFSDLKKGDRFWYENQGFRSSFTLGQLTQIRKYTLSRLLCNTGDNILTIQPSALLLPDYDKNPRVSCKSKQIPDLDLQYWKDANYNEDKVGVPTETAHYNKPTYSTLPVKHETTYPTPFGLHPPEVGTGSPDDKYPDLTTSTPETTTKAPYDVKKPTTVGYEGQTAPFIDAGYEPPPAGENPKPEGFDQVIYNLFNDSKNKSQFIVHLTDSLGIYQNNIDNHRYQDKAVKLE